MKTLSRILALTAAAAIAMPVTVLAQGDDEEIEEVVVTGTRSKPRSAADSPVPIDTFNAAQLSQQPVGGMTENLKNLVPSFTATPLTGDGSSFVRSTSLRGLPPDEVLLLVNSKRRHRSALIQHFGAAMSQGSHASDMGMIPSIALKNVEVLRDGAAAQYGSDAIAGVINFILDDSSQGGRVEAQYGQYYEGENYLKVAANIGLELSDSGFANFSLEWTDYEQLIRSHQPYDAVYLELLGGTPAQDSPYSGDKLAQTWGRPETSGLRTAFNLGIELGNGAEAYLFGNYADTEGTYRFFYREIVDNGPQNPLGLDGALKPMPLDPTDPSMGNFCWCNILTGGFTPYLVGDQTDFSAVVGVRGEYGNGLFYDYSGSYGLNRMDYTLFNTLSPTYGPDSLRNFHPGDLKEHDTNLNADFSYPYSDTVNVAFGLEWREENYTMFVGDTQSWVPGPWAEVGGLVDPLAPATCGDAMDEPCNYATPPNGSNGLPGTPTDAAGTFSRDNWSVYGDVEWDISDALLLQVALRFEDFSDFGTTTNGKVAARYSVSDSFTLRAAYSTGFRAPTPGQSNLQTIVLTFDSDNAEQNLEGTLRPTDSLLIPFGGTALKPEDATNISIGFTADIGDNFSITLDYYQVEVEDRIVKTFNLDVPDTPAFDDVDFTKVAFYTNGLETETTGFDLILLYNVDWAGGSSTDFSLAWNSNDTKITGVNTIDHDADPGTPEVAPVSDGVIFNIENNLPENRFSFAANHHMDKWGLTLRANWYDKTADEQSAGLPVDSALMVDIEGRYAFSDTLTLILGANNVFDEFPNTVGILEYPIESVRNHQGLTYPRRSPIGYDGGSWYLKAVYNF